MERDWSSDKVMVLSDDKVGEWIDDKVLLQADNIQNFDDKSLVYMVKRQNDDRVELLCKVEIQFGNTQELDSYDYDKVEEWSTCDKETGLGIDDNWAQRVYDKMKTESIFDTKVLEWTGRFCMEFLASDDELVLQLLYDDMDMDQEHSGDNDDDSHLFLCIEVLHSSCHVGICMGHGAPWDDQTWVCSMTCHSQTHWAGSH